jgi:thiol-disulfide isomerase/thioredoxin
MNIRSHIFCLGLFIVLQGGAEVQAQTTAPTPGKSITLQALAFSQWQKKLSEYRGQIVVVDFWATWCGPCMERFPRVVALHEKYHTEGKVRFVSMNLDDRDDHIALQKALAFLRAQNADLENYRMDEILPDAFEKLDLIGIPAVLIYDATGKLQFRLTGDNPNKQYRDEDVESAIVSLLGNARSRSAEN